MFLLHFSFKYIWAKDFWFLYIRIYQYNLGSYKILVLYRRYLFSLCMAEQENVRKERWRNNHHSLIIILITFAAAGAAATAARKWILWSVLRTVVPNINCCQFREFLAGAWAGAGAGAQGCGPSGAGELGAGEGTTDGHVNSIFVLPCAATSFSQFPNSPWSPDISASGTLCTSSSTPFARRHLHAVVYPRL